MEFSFSQGIDKGGGFCGGIDKHQDIRKYTIQTNIEIHQRVLLNNKVIVWYRFRKEVQRGLNEEYYQMNNINVQEYN